MSVLLAAEADRIQSYLFRSARLREVVGGSQLLTRFCDEVPGLLGVTEDQVITSGGGSFYITFDDETEANRFGAILAEAYYRATGSTLSVAAPVPYDGQNYRAASKDARRALRQAKQSLGGPVATAHFPYIAICDSCGIGLADRHQERFPGDPRRGYLCAACRLKAEERWHGRGEGQEVREPAGPFLEAFYRLVRPDWDKYNWPGRRGPDPGRRLATAAEDIALFDPRDYVAYIIADVNGMGEIFKECKKEPFVQGLSKALTPTLRESLAIPIRELMRAQEEQIERLNLIPALPLIMGGDDLFALVPASWALDIAQRFCREFQDRINRRAKELVDDTGEPLTDTITVTASVVICKRSYPYYLAHEIGEGRLGAAKQIVKALALQEERLLSAVDFEFIISSQLPRRDRKPSKGGRKEPDRRVTLCPYWIDSSPDGWGMTLDGLLTWRLKLSQVSARHLSRLRALYSYVPQPWEPDEEKTWELQRDDILMRASREYVNRNNSPIVQAVNALGGEDLRKWPLMHRTDSKDEDWHGHALPDLLRVWDFALDLTKSAVDYEGGER